MVPLENDLKRNFNNKYLRVCECLLSASHLGTPSNLILACSRKCLIKRYNFYFRILKTCVSATHTHFSCFTAMLKSHMCVLSTCGFGCIQKGNLRDILTNRSLRLAIDSIFNIILLFSDRIFIFIFLVSLLPV